MNWGVSPLRILEDTSVSFARWQQGEQTEVGVVF